MHEFQTEPFDERLGRITKRHRKMAKGYKTKMGKDGLITARPTRRLRFPWKFMLLIAVFCMLFKGAIFASLGPTAYDQRIERLARGSNAEKAGAFLMQPEPVTLWLATQLHPLLQAEIPATETTAAVTE